MTPTLIFPTVLLSGYFFTVTVALSGPLCLECAFLAPEVNIRLNHTDRVYSVAWSPDGGKLASASEFANEDYSVKIWDASTGKLLRTPLSRTSAYSVAWSPDGRQLASASEFGNEDYSVKVWDISTGKLLRTLLNHRGPVYSVAWSPDGRQLASASKDYSVKVWDTSTWKELRALLEHTSFVYSVTWSPDSRQLASASKDHSVKVWDTSTGKLLRTLLNHTKKVFSVAWSPDGRQLASASWDYSVKVWDTSTWKELRTFLNHTNCVYSVAWSPDSRQLASASKDHSVKVWDTSTGTLLRTLLNHTKKVYSVAWSPDGRQLASASWDNSVNVWDVNVHFRLSEDSDIVRDHAALVLSEWIYDALIDATTFRCPPNFVLTSGEKVESTLTNVIVDDPQNRLNSFYAHVRLTSIPSDKRFAFRSVYVIFRGTSQIADILCDMVIQDNHVAYQDHGVGIHTGFHQEIANRARWHLDETIELLEDIARQDEVDGLETEIILTGHSMGGAHAAALYALLQLSDTRKYKRSIRKLLTRVRLISFAAPMIFTKFIREGVHVQPSKELLRVMSSATNYVHRNDPIPRAYSELQAGLFLDALWEEQAGSKGFWLWFVKDIYVAFRQQIPKYETFAKMYRHFLNIRLLNHTRGPWYDFELSAESLKDHWISAYSDAFRNSKHSLVKYSDVVSSHDKQADVSNNEEL